MAGKLLAMAKKLLAVAEKLLAVAGKTLAMAGTQPGNCTGQRFRIQNSKFKTASYSKPVSVPF
ncbi:MAG: hypothetical protein LBK07_06055 [Tannerella sp.]|jgi:hypothetical protein|nr:hypothetical protein [Tannerella sp.]